MSIKNLYSIDSINSKETYSCLLNKHYARRIPSISYAFGIYKKEQLIGICTFGSPPSNALCVGVCGEEYKSDVIELNRLCLNDDKEKNVTSYFLSNCLKRLPKPKIIVSYADTSISHTGYIYQATNWLYTGLSAKRTERYDPDNPQKHSKTVTTTGKIKYEDLSVRERPQKHRYIYFIGTRKQIKLYKEKLNYDVCNYPKGINKRYDASYDIQTQIKMF